MKSIRVKCLFWAIVLLISMIAGGVARAADSLPVQMQLIWATNEPKSPDPKHKPVEADVAKLLENTPYRWKYYYEVHRRVEDVPGDRSLEKIVMSKHCALDIKYLGNHSGLERVQVKLYGDDKLVSMHKETLPLLLAGNAQNGTAWFVLIRKAPPGAKADEAKTN
ncbi:MAG TPA: hypothetical protein VN048_17245 [Verrucomicrobiae bacterium]|jgi:hypothetical protein|nr:hypothetical protein [Verrucomicrobiae bacterium]